MEDEEETIRERQESEVEALKAIYEADFVDLRRGDAWKVYRRPEFTLRIVPNHDSRGVREEHCSVVIRIKFGQDYPAKSPPAVIKVEESKGLSDALKVTLEEELKKKAKGMVGEVMVTELAQFTADWLSGHNKPAFSSFYEEMEANQRREMQIKEEMMEGERRKSMVIQKLKDEQVRREVAQSLERIEEERQKRKKQMLGEGTEEAEQEEQTLLRSRQNQKAFSRSKSTSFSEGSDHGSRVRLKIREEQEITWKGEKLKVEKLEWLGGSKAGGAVYAGMLYPDQRLVAVSEWIFKVRGGKKSGKSSGDGGKSVHDADALLRQAASIEQEVASLQKLSHPNVVQYLAMSAQRHPSHVKLVLVEEYVHGTSLSFFLAENLSLEPEMLQYFATGILEALSYMHEHNCVHRDLRDTSVFVDRLRQVRVAGFSIDKRVRDLLSPEPGEEAEERFPSSVGRGGKKLDVYRFGLLMLSLAKGEIASDPSIPKRLNSVLCDFLKKCLCRDEKDRWSATQLLEHRWLKCRFDKPNELPTVTAERPETPEEHDMVTAVPFVQVGSGMSRLQSEFAFISKIGKGGFGEVMKVKNLLDGQVYAIKKIKLSQANKLSTKKLMREVKLLSRLNHENVVRYYTSWIEVTTISDEKEEIETSFEEASSAVPSEKVKVPKVRDAKKPSILDDLNVRLDPFGNLSELDGGGAAANAAMASEVSISFASKFPDDLAESTDDESDDDAFGTSFLPHSDDWQGEDDDDDESMSGIVFEGSESGAGDSKFGEKSGRVDETDGRGAAVSSERRIEIQVMYIQMEYCDKQTLRSAIDDGLYKDTKRVWRMFREIIEGLVHIHTQGMIHRDLKPVNVFLDSGDHVKIGDFGLATTNMLTSGGASALASATTMTDEEADSDMTGQIGTALYIAPELTAAKTSSYSQKVDLYSLGVIFFEMCYPPLKTGMERIKILTDLRSPDVRLPTDFDEGLLMQQAHIVRWLLHHDPSRRPNSQELLSSDYLPPPQVEEAELRELVRHALANTQSPAYRHLVDGCLAQTVGLAQDITYDHENLRELMARKAPPVRTLLAQERVRRTAEEVFRRHGAVYVQQGHLLPRGMDKLYDKAGAVDVMTRGGKVVSLPYDLRVGFARFLARSKMKSLKRYCIAPVFREYQIFGYHPREQVECAFDVVTPAGADPSCRVTADAEVLVAAAEIMSKLPAFRGISYFFRLSHAQLLRGVLINCGLTDESTHAEVHSVMREAARLSKTQRCSRLVNLGMTEQAANSLMGVLEHEGPPSKVAGALRHLTRKNNQASAMIKAGLSDLQAVTERARLMGLCCPTVVSPSLVHNPGHFSGIMCQLVRKKKRGHEIVAAGGRYDHLLDRFGHLSLTNTIQQQQDGDEVTQTAAGISLALDKLVAVVAADPENGFDGAEVLLVSDSGAEERRAEAALAGKLWAAGVRCLLCGGASADQALEMARETSAKFIVFFRETEGIRVRCLDKDRFQEKKVASADAADFVLRQLRQQLSSGDSCEPAASFGSSGQAPPASSSLSSSSTSSQHRTPDSGVQHSAGSGSTSSSSSSVHVNYNFRFYQVQDKSKTTMTSRKRLESAISAKITPLLALLASGSVVEVLALQLPSSVLQSAAAFLKLDSEESAFASSVRSLLERHSRHRRDLSDICDEIQELRFEQNRSVFVLYSADDHAYATLIAP